MKRALIGGFLSLIGTIWAVAIISVCCNNLVSAWSTPPGRFLYTVQAFDMMLPFVISIVVVLLGLVIMGIEYFKKDIQ